ncbi:MAG TPA: zinc metalloprotease HtpX [Thermoanaerobaculia bacterium]|jgi:heat shock protein HtpX
MNANGLKTALLLGGLTGVLLLLGYAIGGEAGLVMGFLFAAVMNLGAYWFSDRIALKMAGAREVPEAQAPELHSLVANLAQVSGLPKPRVAIIESEAPNAFATGRNPENALVAVTTGILKILDRREISAVLSHELGHVRNRDILIGAVAATIAGAVTMIAQMGHYTMMFGGRDDDEGGGGILSTLLMLILAPLAAMLIQLAISRSREFGADDTGARLSGDPEALATALEKLEAHSKRLPLRVNPAVSHLFIVAPLTGLSVQKLFSSHPPTAERVARLRELSREILAPRRVGQG